MAGPWFSVQKSGDDWKLLETIWISDGTKTIRARVEYRVELAEPETNTVVEAPNPHKESRNANE